MIRRHRVKERPDRESPSQIKPTRSSENEKGLDSETKPASIPLKEVGAPPRTRPISEGFDRSQI